MNHVLNAKGAHGRHVAPLSKDYCFIFLPTTPPLQLVTTKGPYATGVMSLVRFLLPISASSKHGPTRYEVRRRVQGLTL